ncbi:SDR family oxidoreductase [Verticiella sediminum]|uniref:SDR family oxidoreductase n=1 Tax=Verticiella sediminum TaxID=1247510 RepID=A0A556AXL2_9BURK|nr:SDR family NAD(P)-dependent oxidoreductase [Verticiella sediminum]TSH97674.1 SDR family oxidoreductase [Verticiella sediminum]
MKLLENRVAVISGASHPKGIGKATARLFVEHGARVALLDLEEDLAREAARDIDPDPGKVAAFGCDVAHMAHCERAVRQVAEWSSGRIDILINNAAVTQKATFQEISEADFDRIARVNLRGVFLLSRAVLPSMVKQGSGSVICISSLSAQNGGGIFGGAHYCAAKAGVLGMTRAMAKEFGPHGIRVNAIAPGLITTDFSRTGRSDASKDEAAQAWPLQRAGRPHEIAGGCLFLASDLSTYVTGTTLDINGGAYMN